VKDIRRYYISLLFHYLTVKPRCEIERREIDDQDTLICTAFGNPVEVSLVNRRNNIENET